MLHELFAFRDYCELVTRGHETHAAREERFYDPAWRAEHAERARTLVEQHRGGAVTLSREPRGTVRLLRHRALDDAEPVL